MPATLVPTLVLPAVVIVVGLLVRRRPADPRVTWDYRPLVSGFAMVLGAGWFVIGLVRLATGT